MNNKRSGILSLLFCLAIALPGLSQDKKFTGTWQGTLHLGVDLLVVFHINSDGKGGFLTTADSPDQGAFGIKCDTTVIHNNEVSIDMKSLMASFKGTLLNDSTIDGFFKQQASLPLVLKKSDKIVLRNRPQTPVPPFPYRSEDVEYSNADHSLKYGGTITTPEGKGTFPAMVLITGSGAQDRDETILGHKLFAVLADRLTREGFIVLRTDDRGVGKSSGSTSTSTSEDFANDVNNSLDYLLTRPEVDKNKLGLLGHSEGGMIAPIVATKRKDINFIILLAAPGVQIVDLMAEQNAAIAKSNGMSEAAVKEIIPLFTSAVRAIMNAHDTATAVKEVSDAIENWAAKQTAAVLSELDFDSKEKRSLYSSNMIKEFNSPWFHYFMTFDPAVYLEKTNSKVLALNGDKDVQVISSQNLPGIEAALKKNKNKNYEIKELPGLNHLFQECKTCTTNEYGEIEQTISPTVLDLISQWLKRNVK